MSAAIRKIRNFAILLVIVVSAGFVMKDQLLRMAVTAVISKTIGTRVDLGSLSLDPVGSRVRIQDLKIHNPLGFPKGVLADIPDIQINYAGSDFRHRKLHLQRVEVKVKEVVSIKDRNGNFNVDALRISELPIPIDTLVVSIERVVSIDEAQGPKPLVEVYPVNIKEAVYEHLPSADQIVTVIIVQSLQSTAIKGALVYGAAAVAGVSFLPVGAAVLLTARDSMVQDFRTSPRDAYKAALEVFKELGEITQEDPKGFTVHGQIAGSDVKLDINQASFRMIRVRVSARKFLMPQTKIAAGVLYVLEEKLK